ncbi:hypothetical protein OK016_19105 [Vibrio chagasii]|nr:hypothetical protein [Vibrio chagasii]
METYFDASQLELARKIEEFHGQKTSASFLPRLKPSLSNSPTKL